MSNPIPSTLPPRFSLIEFIKSIPSKIIGLVQRTCSAVASFFSNLPFSRSPLSLLTNREIQWLRKEKPHTPPIQPGRIEEINPNPQNTPLLETRPASSTERTGNGVPPYVTFDPALEELRAFVRDAVALGVDESFNQHIAGKVESVQSAAPTLPPVIKSLTKLFVEMGDKAAKPLFQKFSAQKEQMIDPALRKIFKTLMKPDVLLVREELAAHLQSFLHESNPEGKDGHDLLVEKVVAWTSIPEGQRPLLSTYLQPEPVLNVTLIESLASRADAFWTDRHYNERSNLYQALIPVLKDEFKDAAVPQRQHLDKDYIEPVLYWLLLSDQSTPLNKWFAPSGNFSEDLIDKLFERAISLLVEKKIDHFAALLERTMQRRLGEIVHQTMRINSSRIADYFSERFSKLIETMPYTETFDSILQDSLHAQVLAAAAAEKEVEFHRHLLQKARQTVLFEPKKPSEQEAKDAALNYLAIVEHYGSEELFLQSKRLEAFSKQPACLPVMKELIEQTVDLASQGKDPSSLQRSSEKGIYDSIGEGLLDLMMPSKKGLDGNNRIIDVDPFGELWELLYFPDDFKDLIRYCTELTSEFITPDTMDMLAHIKEPVIEIARNLFKTTSRDILRKQLGLIVQKGVGMIADVDSLNALNAVSILPVLNKKLIGAFARQEIDRNMSEYLPLIEKMVSGPMEQRDENKRLFFVALLMNIKEGFRQFDPQEFILVDGMEDGSGPQAAPLSPLEWNQILMPIVQEIESVLLNGRTDMQPPLTRKGVEQKLKTAFKGTSAENNPEVGSLIMDVLFRLGDMSGEWVVEKFAKDSISTAATQVLQPWRSSHNLLISTMAGVLKDKYLGTDAIEMLIAGKTSAPVKNIDAKLSHQIDVTSRLAYDIIISMAAQKGAIASFAIKKILSDRPDMIHNLITDIYQKLLGNRLENENLIIQCCDTVFSSLAAASETIRLRENIRIQHLSVK